MRDQNTISAFLSQASSRLLLVALGALLLLVLALLIITIGLKGSVDRFETELHYRSPLPTESDGELPIENIAMGQTLYVPVYSHIYIHEGEPYPLTATLSIRNTDFNSPLYVKAVRYYDSTGKLVQSYLERPSRLGPLATMEFLVEERDVRGGSGANFIVEWASQDFVSGPVIEAVMIGATSQQGISFVCPGRVLSEMRRDAQEGQTNADVAQTATP
jgi:hypothetical protein